MSTLSLSHRDFRNRTAAATTILLSVIGVAAIGGGIYFYSTGDRIEASSEVHTVARRTIAVTLNEKGELEAKKSVDVKVEVEGRSTIIWLIEEGAQVEEGELLARIASNEIDEKVRAEEIKVQNAKAAAEAADKQFEIMLDQNASDIRKAELALTNAEIEQRKYLEGDSVQMLRSKENALRTAKIKLEQAEDVLKDSRALREKGHLSKRDYERDVLAQIEAKDAKDAAEGDLSTYKTYTLPKELATKASDVDEAAKDLARTRKKAEATEAKDRAQTAAKHAEFALVSERSEKLREQQTKTELRASAAGMVVYDTGPNRWNRREVTEGAEVYERQTIITLPDPSNMLVQLRIHEAKTSMIAIGQEAVVEIEGIPGEFFHGTVTKIAPLADSQNMWLNPDMKEYATEIELNANNHELKPGVTARVNILVRDVENVLALPVQAVHSVGSKQFAFVGRSQEEAVLREIEVGVANDSFVEVKGGLKEGESVLLAVDDMLLATLPADKNASERSAPRTQNPKKKKSSKPGKMKERTAQHTAKDRKSKGKPQDQS